MTDQRRTRLAESNRVEAFSDGVFSIAITLLVLELAIPALRGEFQKELVDEWVSYVAYLAAFANIGVLWMGHHTAFSRIRAVDSGLMWRNLVLLLTVSVVPFPTAVIASAYRVGTPAGPGRRGRGLRGRRDGLRRRLAPAVQLHARPSRTSATRSRHDDFFRLTEPLITLVGYAAAALIGWFVSPGLALAIFLVFPILYVFRVRSAEH